MTTEELLPELLSEQSSGVLALAPIYIPGQIPEIHDADGTPNPNRFGVNRSMITSNANGLLVNVDPYTDSKSGDNIQIFSSLDPTPLLSFYLMAGRENEISHVFLPGHLLVAGFQTFWYVITRNSQNYGTSPPLEVFIRTLLPGGTDPQPDRPGHYRLLAPVLLNVPAGGVTKELAESAEGVRFAIRPYPNMRQFDVITCSWGGYEFHITVGLDQVGQEIQEKVPLDVIQKAGNGDQIFIWRPLDEVHNRASDWSLRTTVYVEVIGDLLRPVILEAVQVDPDTGELFYDLAALGNKDIQVDVVTRPVTFELQDTVKLSVSQIKDGVESVVFTETKTVTQIDSTVRFFLPSATVQQLAREHIYFRYELTKRSSGKTRRSSRTTVWIKGTAVNLPAPKILPINGVVVDPTKAATGIVSPHAAIAPQVWLHFYAIGTAPGGVVHLYDSGRRISSSQATRDMTFPMQASFIGKIDGGPLDVYYKVGSSQDDPLAVESLRHSVRVGEPKPDLEAVFVVDAVDGVLDPEQLPPFADAEVQVLPFRDMKGHTVYLWYQSDNPVDSQRYEDSVDIDDRDIDIPVSFYLAQDFLNEHKGYRLAIGYSAEPTDGSGTERFGATTTVSIGNAELPLLPKPKVLEADANGVVKPSDTIVNGASIRINDADLKFGDFIKLWWDGAAGNDANTDYYYEQPISFNDDGKPFVHQVPYKHVQANQNVGVQVWYEVEREAGGVQESEVLLLNIQEAALPLPAISEAKGPNQDQINPDDVLADGASALIGVTAQLKEGDVVTLTPSGGSPIVYTVLKSDEGQELTRKISRTFIEQNNGGSFTLGYTIKRKVGGPIEASEFKNFDVRRVIGSGTLKVMGARHNSNTYRSSSLPCLMWAFNAQTLQPMLAEWRYVGDTAWIAGTRFIDTDSERALQVRSSTDQVTLNPVNICGNGVDANISGAAAVAVLRDSRRSGSGAVGGRDLVGFGNASYGGNIPPVYLIQENLRAVFCSGGAFVALTREGAALPWGEAGSGGNMGAINPDGFKTIASNSYAFAGLTTTGDVRCWGRAANGGTLPAGGLSNIKRIFNGGLAFAAERMDGSITAWGAAAAGGVANPVPGINNVEKLICSYQAFAGITQTKRLFAFGGAAYGGSIPAAIANRTDIQRLCCANARAFVALTSGKNVVAWGDNAYGGNLTSYPGIAALRFVDVASTWQAFAGITENNRVAAWGAAPAGVVPAQIASLTNAIQVVGAAHAFAVLCADGRVFAWGNATLGGNTAPVAAQLVNVVAIYTNSHGFIALTSDNRVVTWGHATAIGGATGLNGFVSYIDSTATGMEMASTQADGITESQ
ncbi:RCC1 domain-containing protein [Pseudomonas sp. EL_65y_Pfl2_R96]|uniref:RCC1 domain-containing protein n=1 Tax=Pseudomonas sp. EL_65y_Pfl2_R96 TaxID=3088699 RepID=UPI0030DBB8E2